MTITSVYHRGLQGSQIYRRLNVYGVWDMIGRRVEDFPSLIRTLAELRLQIQKTWDEISQAEIDNLILNMPRHLNEWIRLRRHLS
jgi:hypothetical protein